MKACCKGAFQSLAVICVSLVAIGAFAQGTEPDHLYLGIGLGPIIPQSVNANLTGTISGSGTLHFNASGFVGLLGGYRVTDHFGVDAEGGWSLYDSHDLVGAFSGSLGSLPGDIPLNGDMHTWLGLANCVYRPRRSSTRLAPYFGAGVGAAGLEWLVDSRPGGNIILSLRGGSVSFAADAIVGVEYSLTQRLLLGGRYNFVHVANEIPTISGGGISLSHSTPEIHLLQMTMTYRF